VKRKYIVFGLLAASSLYGFGQQRPDTAYARKKLRKTDIQLVYSQYIQNGNHSAITGGIGTEKLLVYSTDLSLKHQLDSLHSYSIRGGLDVITSASLDNIDFVVSSASRVSNHAYLQLAYNQAGRRSGLSFEPSGYFSIESAYLSLGLGLSVDHTNPGKTRELSADLQTYFDDLRWGRLNGERPLQLVYPAELRDQKWFSAYLRQSYNLSLGLQQTLNRRMQLGLFPGFSYQHGLLSTPYHRVYFKDGSEKVEKLPSDRFKIPWGIQLNSFLGDRYILRSYYRFYWDNFGVIAHTLDLALAIKLSPAFSISPSLRLYTQTGANAFRPYKELAPSSAYYTSNYDLSSFQSIEPGLEARYSGAGRTGGGLHLGELALRYAYYHRTDGLYAHIITLLSGVSAHKKSEEISAF
jgi:hypothetical protein